jgi:A/G-specific adenine glycosylase
MATERQLQHLLRPLGLWRRKTNVILALSREMSRRHGRFPRSRNEIEELPGIGQYIANAILLFCHAECAPLLDVNMARVLERAFGPRQLADIRYDPYLQNLAMRIVKCDKPAKLNWAILDLAALVCTSKKPNCDLCPVAFQCLYKKNNKTHEESSTRRPGKW